MKKYKVEVLSKEFLSIEVDAHDKEEARLIAEDADGGEFKSAGFGDWEINNVEEIIT